MSERKWNECDCPIHCKYCGAQRKRDLVGHYCGTRNCQWQHGFKGCTGKRIEQALADGKEGGE